MKREMHHKERQMNASETRSLMDSAEIGILPVNGDDGYPYGVPVNCVYINDCIYFHCAQYGYKLDAIKANPKVCFTVILAAQILRNKFTANFASVIATGTFFVIGIVNYYILQFRGLPLVPWDIFSIGTAAEVADNYEITVDVDLAKHIYWFILLLLAGSKTKLRLTKG